MCHWMEAINMEVPRDELPELRSVFVKIFDPDMSPLGFDAREMYQFISDRLVILFISNQPINNRNISSISLRLRKYSGLLL